MGLCKGANMARSVALRKESVDRNYNGPYSGLCPSAVALRKESVDRNNFGIGHGLRGGRRSPQGERG